MIAAVKASLSVIVPVHDCTIFSGGRHDTNTADRRASQSVHHLVRSSTRTSIISHFRDPMFFDALRYLEDRRELVVEVVRIYLGAGLLFRGIALVGLDTGLEQLAGGAAPDVPLTGVALYVAAAHIIGGAMLLAGLFTRLAALIQLPIVAGAVFLVHWQEGLLAPSQSLEFSALVLFLLLLVLVFGGGPWSVDARWRSSTTGPSAAAPAS